MTEYDYSPEAMEAHILKQQKIAYWVDNTKRQPPANPFTPATPAVHALQMRREELENRHRRKESRSSRDRHRDQDRDRDIFNEPPDFRQHGSSPPSAKRSYRSNSASYSANTARPDPTRGRTLPAPLHLPPQNGFTSSGNQSSQQVYGYYTGHPMMTSPRDSKHSSRTSSSTLLPTHYTQPTPHSAPVIPRPMRSQTTPPNYSYPMPQHPQYGSPSYLPNAPQFPYSHYQTKQPPLFKRLFMGWGNNKQQQHKPPRRKRSSSL